MTVLRRATRDDLSAVTALQRAAYAKNRAILGVEPLPLMADYGRSFRITRSIWRSGRARSTAC